LIDKVIILEQIWISKDGVVEATNVTFDEEKFALRKIVSPYAFVKNEQWSVVCMKEEFHVRFATILQIIYQ
jgi:hypothetical protein